MMTFTHQTVCGLVSMAIDDLLLIPEALPMTQDEIRTAEHEGVGAVIYNRLVSTKFRKSALDPEVADSIRKYVESVVAKGDRLRLYFLFGGYKQARFASAPNPDWAEVFNIQFVLAIALAVESVYAPGVDVIYRGDEVVMALLDNYKRSARQTYAATFNATLDIFRDRIPADRNIGIHYELTSEISPEDELFALMRKLYAKHEKAFAALPEEVQQAHIQASYRNQCWDGEEDLTGLSEVEKREKAKTAYIMHDAFLDADIQIADAYFRDGISISFRRGVPGCVHYGSCSSSAVQFWAGEGFFNVRDDRVVPWILSYEQQQLAVDTLVEVPSNPFAAVGLSTARGLHDYQD